MSNANKRDKFNFLFDKISMPGFAMAYWISIPEFQSDIEYLIKRGFSVDDKSVYNIARRIYEDKTEGFELYGYADDFKANLAWKGLAALEEALGMS